MKSMRIAAVLAFVAGSTVGLAAERTISQKGKVFSEAAMEITDVRVKLMADNPHHVRAFCSIAIDDAFAVRDLAVVVRP